ncbi:MAG: hypothetical protein P4L22_06000 [Candidatus Babeliales bacterium]|nr:hypothetical protein [Candidatus Babeliales bacterium]
MIKLNCFVIVFLIFSNNQILSSESEKVLQHQSEQDMQKREQSESSAKKYKEGRENYLTVLKKRNQEFNYIGSRLMLENKNEYLRQVLDLLNLVVLQDQDWEKFSKTYMQRFSFLNDENSLIVSLVDLFLRIWYFRKFNDEIHANLYEEDLNALTRIYVNENQALIVFTPKFRYRMNIKTGEYFIYSDSKILNNGIIDKDLVIKVNKTLLNQKKAWQTQQQMGLAAIVIVLLIYSVLCN